MKKTKVFTILMLFVFTFTACAKQAPEEFVEIEKPTTTIYNMQFEIEESWVIEKDGEGGIYIYFNETDELGLHIYRNPDIAAQIVGELDADDVFYIVDTIAYFSGFDAPVEPAIEISINGNPAFCYEGPLVNDDLLYANFFYCVYDNGPDYFVWSYTARPAEFEANIEKVKAILNSTVFVGNLEIASEAPPISGNTYVFADAMEFEIESDWNITLDNSELFIEFDPNALALMRFYPPTVVPSLVIDEEMAIALMNEFATMIGGEATSTELAEVTIDGQVAWEISGVIDTPSPSDIKVIFWMCNPTDSRMGYMWIYMATEEYYDTYLSQVQALVNSIRFI